MIYIHIPFCVRKCLYCDFYSVTDKSLFKAYTDALIKEIESIKGTHTDTVYIGGGTPTAIVEYLLEIVDAVNDNLILSDDCEFTVEANPGTVDMEILSGLWKRNVNRISCFGMFPLVKSFVIDLLIFSISPSNYCLYYVLQNK